MIYLPKKTHIASLDVDAQYAFTEHCPKELPVPEGEHIVDALNAQAKLAAIRVGTKDAHSHHAHWITEDPKKIGAPIAHEHMNAYWPRHAVVGTKGFNLIQGLPDVTDYDYFVWKGIEPHMHPYGACYHDLNKTLTTGLIEFLHSNAITHVIIGGLATEYCVKESVLEIQDAGFQAILHLEACRHLSEEAAENTYKVLKAKGVIIINTLKELAPC